MNSNGTMFGMCNPEAAGVYGGHHPHHQSQHYTNSSPAELGGSPAAYCGSVTTTNSESSTGNGGHNHYGLHAAAAAQAAAVAAAASSVSVSESGSTTNNNRSNSVEAGSGGGQHSPTGIISDNGLQYANLDGSVGPPGSGGGGGGGYPSYGHHPAMTAGYHYSDIHGDGSLAAAVAASGASQAAGNISAYFDNSTAAAAAYAQSQYPSIYGQHHPHSLKSIRGSAHDFSPSSYPADFAAAAAVSKPAPAVPTYKWMQVKRNVPKPGRSIFENYISFLSWT